MTLWILGGLDPTGGAGVLRDRRVAAELAPALEIVAVITAVTQQGDGRPARSLATPPARLAAALAGVPDATGVKLGLVPTSCVSVVAAALARVHAPRVLDPVLRASDGGDLGASVEGLLRLAPQVDLITPNGAEAAALLGELPRDDDALLVAAGRLGGAAVLFKNVSGEDPAWVRDRLVSGGRCIEFRRPRGPEVDPRGTGCALATAITCGLAAGRGMLDACGAAIAWLDTARTRTYPGPDGRPHLASPELDEV